jgi:hypothetical protein
MNVAQRHCVTPSLGERAGARKRIMAMATIIIQGVASPMNVRPDLISRERTD